jgi:TRAP-type C4-dicarboxylate transport system substrate-binding protein
MVRSGRRKRLVLLATVAALGAIGAAASLGMGARSHAAEFTLKFGYVTGAAHPYGQTMLQFERIVEQATNGRVDIQPQALYAQGDDVQLLNDVKGNVISGGAVSTTVFTTGKINSYVALQMPFLIDNYALEQRVISNSSGIAQQMLKKGSDKAGLVGLALFEGGMRQFALKDKVINTAADVRGLKIRVPPGTVISDTFRALGASPTPIAIGQVFQSVQTGVVDGMEANSALVSTFRFDNAGIKNISIANLFPFPAAVVMSKEAFNALPADVRATLRDAAKDLPAYSISVVSGTGNTTNVPALNCSRGVKYHQVPSSGRTSMIRAVRSVYTKYQKDKQVAAFISQIQKLKARPAFKGGPTDVPPASCLS